MGTAADAYVALSGVELTALVNGLSQFGDDSGIRPQHKNSAVKDSLGKWFDVSVGDSGV